MVEFNYVTGACRKHALNTIALLISPIPVPVPLRYPFLVESASLDEEVYLMRGIIDGQNFFEGFDKEFLVDFKNNYFVEYKLFEEYAMRIDQSLWTNDFRHYEIAWRNFAAFTHARSLELVSKNRSELLKSLYGAQNILSSLPGPFGAFFNGYSNFGSYKGGGKFVNLVREALQIKAYGPQLINESTFKKFINNGRPYDPSLNSIIKKIGTG